MTTKQIINLAYEHYIANYTGGIDTEYLICQYAQDELGLSEERAYNYYQVNQVNKPTKEELNNFYVWYYVNIVCKPSELLDALQEAYNKFSKFNFIWEGRETTEGQLLLSNMKSAIKKFKKCQS